MSGFKFFSKEKGFVIVAVAAAIAIAAFALKYASDHRDFSKNTSAMNQALESMVFVNAYNQAGAQVAQGGGFVVYNGKTILTNFRTVGESTAVSVFTGDGRSFEAVAVAAYDADWDWAILLLGEDTGLAPLTLGSAHDTSIGSRTVILSAASKIQRIVTPGTFNSRISGPLSGPALCITADYAPLQGGVVFNEKGRAVGLTCLGSQEAAEGLVFAVPIERLPAQSNSWEARTLAQVYFETHPEALYQQECHWLSIETLYLNPIQYDGQAVGLEGHVVQVDHLNQSGTTNSTVVWLTSGKSDTNRVRVIVTPGTAVNEGCQWKEGEKLRVYGECLYATDFGAEFACANIDAKIIEATED